MRLKIPLNRNQIAHRVAEEIEKGFIVNLGIGIPALGYSFCIVFVKKGIAT